MTEERKKQVVMLLAKPYSVAVRMRSEAETLVDAGFEVTVLAWDRLGREPKVASVNNVNVISLRLLRASNLFIAGEGSKSSKLSYALSAVLLQLYSVAWCLKELNGKAIIHCNFNTLLAGAVLKVFKPMSIKLAYDSHELTPALYAEWYGSAGGLLAGAIEKILLRHVDLIITVSPPIQSYLSSLTKDLPASKRPPIILLYNTVKSSDLPPGDKSFWRSRLGLSGFVISFVVSLRGVYALDELVEVAGQFKSAAIPANFVIVGGGGPEQERLRQTITQHQLGGYVKIIPQVPHQEALAYQKASDVSFAVNKSLEDNSRLTLPWKVFESMACGTPVIVLANTVAWDFVQQNGIGFAAASSQPSEIQDKLLWAVGHPNILTEMSSKAREAYTGLFNWEMASQRFLDAYSAL